MSPRRADVFVPESSDPRGNAPVSGGEREVLLDYLRGQRLTLELKCSDLTVEQLAQRSLEPSNLSLLGLVRHLADVERGWMRRVMAGLDAPDRWRERDSDRDFDGAVGEPAVADEAWAAWREEAAWTDDYVASAADLGVTGDHHGEPIQLREVVVHLIEEYARHNGHADILRERIDGRVGQ